MSKGPAVRSRSSLRRFALDPGDKISGPVEKEDTIDFLAPAVLPEGRRPGDLLELLPSLLLGLDVKDSSRAPSSARRSTGAPSRSHSSYASSFLLSSDVQRSECLRLELGERGIVLDHGVGRLDRPPRDAGRDARDRIRLASPAFLSARASRGARGARTTRTMSKGRGRPTPRGARPPRRDPPAVALALDRLDRGR